MTHIQQTIIQSQSPLLTVKEIMQILKIKNRLSIYRMAKKGELKKADVPGPLRFDMYENNVSKYVQLVDATGKPV